MLECFTHAARDRRRVRPSCRRRSGDPLAAPHTYLSDFQDDVEVGVYTDYREMIADDVVDAVNDFTTLALHHEIAGACLMPIYTC